MKRRKRERAKLISLLRLQNAAILKLSADLCVVEQKIDILMPPQPQMNAPLTGTLTWPVAG